MVVNLNVGDTMIGDAGPWLEHPPWLAEAAPGCMVYGSKRMVKTDRNVFG